MFWFLCNHLKYQWQLDRGITESYNPSQGKDYPVQSLGTDIVSIAMGRLYRDYIKKRKDEQGKYKFLLINNRHDDITLDCTNYTVLCDTNINNNITVKLPFNNNSISGRIYILKNIGNSNNFFLNPQGSNIDTNSSIITISPFYNIRLQSDGTDWWSI